MDWVPYTTAHGLGFCSAPWSLTPRAMTSAANSAVFFPAAAAARQIRMNVAWDISRMISAGSAALFGDLFVIMGGQFNLRGLPSKAQKTKLSDRHFTGGGFNFDLPLQFPRHTKGQHRLVCARLVRHNFATLPRCKEPGKPFLPFWVSLGTLTPWKRIFRRGQRRAPLRAPHYIFSIFAPIFRVLTRLTL